MPDGSASTWVRRRIWSSNGRTACPTIREAILNLCRTQVRGPGSTRQPYGLDFHNGRALRNSQDGRDTGKSSALKPHLMPGRRVSAGLSHRATLSSRAKHRRTQHGIFRRSTRRQARCDTGCFSLQSRWSTSNDPPRLSRRPSRTVGARRGGIRGRGGVRRREVSAERRRA